MCDRFLTCSALSDFLSGLGGERNAVRQVYLLQSDLAIEADMTRDTG